MMTDEKTPFGFLSRDIMGDPFLSTTAKALYALLCTYAGAGMDCFPSQERLSVELNVTTRTVQNALQELQKRGIVRIQRGGYPSFKGNVYRLLDGLDRKPNEKQIVKAINRAAQTRS